MSVRTLAELAAAAQRAREAGDLCVPLSIDECEAVIADAARANATTRIPPPPEDTGDVT